MPTAPSRVLVYGVTGSGKSTLAAAVAARLGLSLVRLVRRTAVRIVRRTTVCGDNVETLRRSGFAHDSIVRFHFQSFGRKRRRMREWHAAEPARVVLLRSPRETVRWLRDLG